MHHSLNKLFNYLEEHGNVLTGRVQLFTLSRQELNRLKKCGVTITATELTSTNSLIEKTYHFLGFAQTTTNKVEDKSRLFEINAFFAGSPLWTFEFGFNDKKFYGTYETFGGRIEGYESFERKEIKSLEVRFKNNEEQIDWNSKPVFIIVEALEHLKRKLAQFFKSDSAFSIYKSNAPADTTLVIGLTNNDNISKEKLAELIKEDNLFENLLDYNLTAIVVRNENANKTLYVLDL